MPDTALTTVEERPIAEAPQQTNFIKIVEAAVMNPDINPDTIERLLTMQERTEDRQARAAYAEAMAELQPKLPTIAQRGMGQNQTKYAKWEDIHNQVTPILSDHGFALTFRTAPMPDGVVVTAVLTHRAGHCETTDLPLPNDKGGQKNAVQAIGSSISYGKRYAACALLNINVGGEDNDGETKGPSKSGARDLYKDMQEELRQCMNLEALREWDQDCIKKGLYEKLPDDWFTNLKEEYTIKRAAFE
ncbi:MAG: ERF family protein [Pseudomonadota bacterium]